jgi:hypothetical protein
VWFRAERLLENALRCGIGVEAFWGMTPVETYMAIEAAIWRDERRQKQDTALAWRMAALMRSKRLPSLKNLLSTARPEARPLSGEELERRREEFREMSAAVDLERLGPALEKLAGTKRG